MYIYIYMGYNYNILWPTITIQRILTLFIGDLLNRSRGIWNDQFRLAVLSDGSLTDSMKFPNIGTA